MIATEFGSSIVTAQCFIVGLVSSDRGEVGAYARGESVLRHFLFNSLFFFSILQRC